MMVIFFHVLKTHDGDHSLHVLKDGVCLLNNMFMKMMMLFVPFYKVPRLNRSIFYFEETF
jgi:hypothetical protein